LTGLRDRNSFFLEGSDESDEKWYVGPKCCACTVIIQLTNNDARVTMSKGVIQKMSCSRSKRSIKTRKFYTAGNEAVGRWVEEATRTATSIQKEVLLHRHVQWQASLQQEVDKDSDATVLMKYNAEEGTYSMSEEMHEDSDATVIMKDDAHRNTYSPSGDETKEKRSELGEDMGKCNTVPTEEEIYILNINFRPATNTKMLFL
jgi:hypothetical protein